MSKGHNFKTALASFRLGGRYSTEQSLQCCTIVVHGLTPRSVSARRQVRRRPPLVCRSHGDRTDTLDIPGGDAARLPRAPHRCPQRAHLVTQSRTLPAGPARGPAATLSAAEAPGITVVRTLRSTGSARRAPRHPQRSAGQPTTLHHPTGRDTPSSPGATAE